MVKLCAACCEELPKEEFSVKQWRQKQYQRRCKGCIVANNPLKLKPPPKPACWICLDEQQHEITGAPLRRDCACRGDAAGFVHLPCLVQYAKKRSTDTGDLMEQEQWTTCPNCLQEYGWKLALDMADEFITFVETDLVGDGWAGRRRDGRIEIIPRHLYARVGAHSCKLSLIMRINRDKGTKRSAGAVVELMQRIRLTGGDDFANQSIRYFVLPPDTFLLDAEKHAHLVLGLIYEKDATEEGYGLAIAHYEQAKALHEELGEAADVAMMEEFAAKARSKLDGTYEEEEDLTQTIRQQQLKAIEQGDRERLSELATSLREQKEDQRVECQQRFESDYAKFGITPATVENGVDFILSMHDANHGIKAERLAVQLFASSSTVLGPHHDCTKMLKRVRHVVQTRRVVQLQDKRLETYHAVRYDAVEDKYVLRGPVASDDYGERCCEGTHITVDANEVIPRMGSPVVVHGVQNELWAQDELSRFNGKIGDVRGLSYDNPYLFWVHFEDGNTEPTLFDVRFNLRVLIDLPNKE